MALDRRIRLATRGSPLALFQANLVAEKLREALGHEGSQARTSPSAEVELVVVQTLGDRDQSAPLHAIGGQGVFIAEVEEAVLDGRADAAVHSAKDLPSTATLPLVAVLERGDPRDALVGGCLDDLRPGSVVATGSVRRRAQLAFLRPDLVFTEARGNIATRLAKMPPGGALVVAAAALERLGLAERASQLFTVREMLPQVGQGAIAVTASPASGSLGEIDALWHLIDHPSSRRALEAERAYLAVLGGGCELPVGAYATVEQSGAIVLEAMIASPDGHSLVRRRHEGSDPVGTGTDLAAEILSAGGAALLHPFGRLPSEGPIRR